MSEDGPGYNVIFYFACTEEVSQGGSEGGREGGREGRVQFDSIPYAFKHVLTLLFSSTPLPPSLPP